MIPKPRPNNARATNMPLAQGLSRASSGVNTQRIGCNCTKRSVCPLWLSADVWKAESWDSAFSGLPLAESAAASRADEERGMETRRSGGGSPGKSEGTEGAKQNNDGALRKRRLQQSVCPRPSARTRVGRRNRRHTEAGSVPTMNLSVCWQVHRGAQRLSPNAAYLNLPCRLLGRSSAAVAATPLAAACMHRGPSTAMASSAVPSAPWAWLVTRYTSAATATLMPTSASSPKAGEAGPHIKPTVLGSRKVGRKAIGVPTKNECSGHSAHPARGRPCVASALRALHCDGDCPV